VAPLALSVAVKGLARRVAVTAADLHAHGRHRLLGLIVLLLLLAGTGGSGMATGPMRRKLT
jgi:ABC-type transporter Mla maintaining outer membrane lipid asymmetry permease subunit MlaE